MKYKLILYLLFVSGGAFAQDNLTLQKAINLAVENNFDLRIAKNNTENARLKTTEWNRGYLPTLSATGGVNYADENQDVTFSDGTGTSITGAITESYNASMSAEYLIFDGFVRKFNNTKNEADFQLSKYQERQQIENKVLEVYEKYFNVAFQQQVVDNLLFNIKNSEDRLQRSQRKLKYGQGTKLDELNAQVDLNNDSIAYMEAVQNLNNYKRDLNLLLGQNIEQVYNIDTKIDFSPIPKKDEAFEIAKEENINLQLSKQNVSISEIDIKINKARFLPKITGSGSFNWNESQNPPTSFALANEASGINLGLNLTWNLFDGSNVANVKTAKITKANREIELQQTEQQIKLDVLNAYETYSLAQYTLFAESKNVETNTLNFERSQSQFSLGQITAVEIRQAQINLLNAKNNQAKAKYDLKFAEANLLQTLGIFLQ